MSKSYYLAADGGGTKLQTILYDADLRVIRTGRGAGVNTLFKPVDDVHQRTCHDERAASGSGRHHCSR